MIKRQVLPFNYKMASRVGYSLLLACAMLVAPSALQNRAMAETPNITVTVTGIGPTIDDAKQDAVRKALQYAVKQLVVVERKISGDAVLRDRVMSTANGYIEMYVEKSVRRTTLGVEVVAEITVSASRIENFLGIAAGGGGDFSGPLLDQEVQRRVAQAQAERAQAKARGEIIDRLFEEFPWSAFQLRLLKIDVAANDPNTLVLELEASYKPQFLNALQSTLDALAYSTCNVRTNPQFFDLGPNVSECFGRDDDRLDKNAFCFLSRETNAGVCYLLKRGDYCNDCKKLNGTNINYVFQPMVFGRFVSEDGSSAMLSQDCIRADPKFRELSDFFSFSRSPDGPFWYSTVSNIAPTTKRFSVNVSATDVDLKRAARFVAILGNHGAGTFSSRLAKFDVVAMSSQTPRNACRLVDDAVRHYRLTK